jgi:parvulin-like peptidyl-prolyl isomerase
VTRRIPIALAALAATGLLAACTTFSTNDSVAEVGDATLTRDQLAGLVPAGGAPGPSPTSNPAPDEAMASGDAARSSIQLWVLGQLLTDEVVANGGEVTDADREAAEQSLAATPEFTGATEAGQELIVDAQAAYVVWGQQLADEALDEERVRPLYEAGVAESGIVCAAHILVASEEEANEVIAELENGASFIDLAAQRSTDTGSAPNGGSLGCVPSEQFEQQFVPEFVAGASGLEIGATSEPVQSEFGWHVIQLPTFDDARDALATYYSNPQQRLPDLVAAADVFVDPRFGTFTPEGIVPLGPPPAPATQVL